MGGAERLRFAGVSHSEAKHLGTNNTRSVTSQRWRNFEQG